MPDTNTPPKETAEQTASRLTRRYGWMSFRLIFLWAVVFGTLLTLWMKAFDRSYWLLILMGLPLICLGCLAVIWWTSRQQMRRFVGRISEEEKAALRAALAAEHADNAAAIREILRYSGEIFPAKEYVRASSPPEQTDTLLRAALPSADTAQEQLLRPTQE